MKSKKQASWSDVKASLSGFDRNGLIGIIRNLYEASSSNRRFLHARFVPAAAAVEEYRDLVRAAVFPDPLSERPIRLRDATAAIAKYKRSTGDLGGVVDLLLTFVEAGTEQAADLGYGDDAYFATLERKVNEAVAALDALPDAARGDAMLRLVRLGEYQDYLGGVTATFSGTLRPPCRLATQLKSRGRSPRGLTNEWSRRALAREPARLIWSVRPSHTYGEDDQPVA